MRAAKVQASLRIRAVKICNDGMLEDTYSLDGARIILKITGSQKVGDIQIIIKLINNYA